MKALLIASTLASGASAPETAFRQDSFVTRTRTFASTSRNTRTRTWANLFNKDGLPTLTFRTDNW